MSAPRSLHTCSCNCALHKHHYHSPIVHKGQCPYLRYDLPNAVEYLHVICKCFRCRCLCSKPSPMKPSLAVVPRTRPSSLDDSTRKLRKLDSILESILAENNRDLESRRLSFKISGKLSRRYKSSSTHSYNTRSKNSGQNLPVSSPSNISASASDPNQPSTSRAFVSCLSPSVIDFIDEEITID